MVEKKLSLYISEKNKEVYIRSTLIANDRHSAPGSLREKKKDEKDGEEVEPALNPNNQEGRMAHFRYSWISALKQHIRALLTHLSLHLLLYVFWLHTQEEENMATHGSMFLSFTIQVERSFPCVHVLHLREGSDCNYLCYMPTPEPITVGNEMVYSKWSA